MSAYAPIRFALVALVASLTAPVAVAETAPKPATRQSLALISITHGEGFTDQQSGTLQELLLTALQATGRFKVIGQSDINALLSIEAKKQAVGCADTDCAVQLAGALGAELAASADVGRLGDNTLLTLKVISIRSASVVARAQATVQSDNDLPAAARTLASDIVTGLDGGEAVAQAAKASTPRKRSLPARITGFVFIGLAAVAGGVAIGLGQKAQSGDNSLHTKTHAGAEALSLMNSSNTDALGADISIGAAALLGSVGIGLAARF